MEKELLLNPIKEVQTDPVNNPQNYAHKFPILITKISV
jgi:hypothetical protein